MAKVTLSAQRDVIRQAKRLAGEGNTSVSAMFSSFIKTLAASKTKGGPLGRLTRRASGVIRLPRGRDYKAFLADSFKDKYGL